MSWYERVFSPQSGLTHQSVPRHRLGRRSYAAISSVDGPPGQWTSYAPGPIPRTKPPTRAQRGSIALRASSTAPGEMPLASPARAHGPRMGYRRGEATRCPRLTSSRPPARPAGRLLIDADDVASRRSKRFWTPRSPAQHRHRHRNHDRSWLPDGPRNSSTAPTPAILQHGSWATCRGRRYPGALRRSTRLPPSRPADVMARPQRPLCAAVGHMVDGGARCRWPAWA